MEADAKGTVAARGQIVRRFESAEHGEEQDEIACPLCGSRSASQVLLARDLLFHHPGRYPLVRCQGCELEYVNPRPTPAALGRHYPTDYFGYSRHEDAPSFLQPFLRAAARSISLRRIRYLEQAIGRIQPAASILDVGCGVNRLLQSIAEERNAVGTGLDFKPEIVAYVRDELRMPVVEGTLQSAAFEAGSFDLVLMMEYLEHELDPRGVLENARRIIRPGGHLALELPHIASGPGRWFGRYWWNLDIPRHMFFFTEKTLREMLDQCGYDLVSVKPFTLPFYVGLSVLQALGMRYWRRYRALYPSLSTVLGLPFLPFQALMPEFVFAVARVR